MLGESTQQLSYMDVTLIIFPVSLEYFEIIFFSQIVRKKLTYIKLTQVAFQEC